MSSMEGSKENVTAAEGGRGKKGKDQGHGGGQGGGGGRRSAGKSGGGARLQFDDASRVARVKKSQIVKREIQQSQIPFLNHLPQYEKRTSISRGTGFGRSEIHPAIQRLGVKYAGHVITGGHDRCLALVDAFYQFVADFVMTDEDDTQDLRWELDRQLKRCIQFVVECRPMSVSMGHFVRYLKGKIAHLPATISEIEGKEQVLAAIRFYKEQKLERPLSMIADAVSPLIVEGDRVIVYSHSKLVREPLKQAAERGIDFSVAVIDSRPEGSGREMAQFLDSYGISVDYGVLTGASYLMRGATKVLLGAHSIMGDGAVTSRAGTASIALLAKSQRVPVMVVCETIKFFARVQLDSIAFNELGDPAELGNPTLEAEEGRKKGNVTKQNKKQSQQSLPSVHRVNLNYDITPAEYIHAVICEVGTIPPSAVIGIIEADFPDL